MEETMKNRYQLLGLLIIIIATIGLTACRSESTYEKAEPVELIDQGDGRNLVILTEKAAERLDIQTEQVREQEVTVKQTYGAEVAEADLAKGALVMVSLSPQEMSMVNPDIPARVYRLDAGDPEDEDGVDGFSAELDEQSNLDDEEDDDRSALYYAIKENADLVPGQRLMVELAMKSEEGIRLVVPSSSLLYDVYGETYIYVNPEPLHFLRVPVVVDHIQGDLVVLQEGPAAGTSVVTVGAVELYGADTGVGK